MPTSTTMSSSPAKESLKPNPHPYAIKTTSTALLSRSNSTSSSSKVNHHYVPSPTGSPSPSRISHRHPGTHRYSKSLTEQPRPLPAPPSPSPSKSQPLFGFGYDQGLHGHSPSIDIDLPANPKLWTPSQLALYLSTALRIRSGDALLLPAPVARDIASFVLDARITGKAFLRLTESELEDFGVNKLWSSALLGASRSLRQNVLKGRIWGFGSTQETEKDTNGRRLTQSPERISLGNDDDDDNMLGVEYSSASSTSSVDHTLSDSEFFGVPDLDGTPGKRSGRIHAVSSSTVTPPHRVSARALARSKSGHVKGMVQHLERSSNVDDANDPGFRSRSGSESSAGGEETGSWQEVHSRSFTQGTARVRGSSGFSTKKDPQHEPDSMSEARSLHDIAPDGKTPFETASKDDESMSTTFLPDEEPSIEHLLAQQTQPVPALSGVTAWEQDGVVTMRRVAVDPNAGRPLPTPPILPTSRPLTPSHTPGRPLPIPLAAPRPTSASASGSLRRLDAVWSIEAGFNGDVASVSGNIANDELDVAAAGPAADHEGVDLDVDLRGYSPNGKHRAIKIKPSSAKNSIRSAKRLSATAIFANANALSEIKDEVNDTLQDDHRQPDAEAENARAAIIAAAEAELAESRMMLATFRARLEDVERSIAVLEERQGEKERAPSGQANSQHGIHKRDNDAQTETSPAARPGLLGSLDAWIRASLHRYLPPWLVLRLGSLPPFSFLSPTTNSSSPQQHEESYSSSGNGNAERGPRSSAFATWFWLHSPLRWEPTRLRALPSYLLLVGIGVAAIVLRVVVRRVGYGARYGLRGTRTWRK